MSERVQKYVLPGSIIFIGLLLFWEALSGKSIWISDLYVMESWMDTFPYKEFIANSYGAGYFPLWTHNLECGYPLGSYPHAGSFYPFNLFFIFMDYVRGLNWLSLFQVLVLSFSAYCCCRELGLERLASWFVALSFSLSGFAYVSAGSLHFHSTICWIPLVFLFSLRIARAPRLGNALWLLCVCLMQLSAGELEQIFYQDLIIFFYLLFVKRIFWRNLVPWLVLICFSGLGFLIQLLPSANLIFHSYRQIDPQSFGPIYGYLFSPLGLLSPVLFPMSDLMVPSPFYMGFLFLLGIYFAWRTPVYRWELKLLLGFGILYLVFLANIWPINHFHLLHKFISPDAHYKLIAPFQFWMLIAAGQGLNQLCKNSLSKEQMRSALVFIFIFALFTLALALVFFIIQSKISHPSIRIPILPRSLFSAVALSAVIAFALCAKKQWSKNCFLTMLSLVFLADILGSAWSMKPTQSSEPFLNKPAGTEFLKKREPWSRFRFVSPALFLDKELLRYIDLSNGPGYVYTAIRLSLKRTTPLLLKSLSPDSNMIIRNMTRINEMNKQWLDFLGVKYIVARSESVKGIKPEAISLMKEDLDRFFLLIYNGEVMVYENNSARERFSLKQDTGSGEAEAGEVKIMRWDAQKFEVKAIAYAESRLINIESYYPGWRAYVNGVERKIDLADDAFQAVRIPGGASVITFIYQPLDFEIGLWFSLASAGSLLLLLGLWVIKMVKDARD